VLLINELDTTIRLLDRRNVSLDAQRSANLRAEVVQLGLYCLSSFSLRSFCNDPGGKSTRNGANPLKSKINDGKFALFSSPINPSACSLLLR
jgi:hypothetical protein